MARQLPLWLVEGSKPGGRLYADSLSARVVEFVYGVVLGWKIRSEVGLGLLFWCKILEMN